MQNDLKADRERLEKSLDNKIALINQRKGVSDFLLMVLKYSGSDTHVSRVALSQLAHEYALKNPFPGEPNWKDEV